MGGKVLFNSSNAHRIIIGLLIICEKYNSDKDFCANKYWSQYGGVGKKDLMLLEGQILKSLDYKLWVKPHQV